MGKKKGGKKGGKKKSGKKSGKKKSTAADPEPSAPERFISHQIEARAAVLLDLRTERDDMLKENMDLQLQLKQLRSTNNDAITSINKQQSTSTQKMKSESDELAGRFETAMAERDESAHTNEAEIAALRQTLAGADRELQQTSAKLKLLTDHKNIISDEWDNKIKVLLDAIADLEDRYSSNKTSLQRQFKALKLHFEESLELKVASTKSSASNAALEFQPVLDKIAYEDNGWLRHEIGEQRTELDRVLDACGRLESDNFRLIEEIFGMDHAEMHPQTPTASGMWTRSSFKRSLSASCLPNMQSMRITTTTPTRPHGRPQTRELPTLGEVSRNMSTMPDSRGSELRLFGNVLESENGLRIVGENFPRRPSRSRSQPRLSTAPSSLSLPAIRSSSRGGSRRLRVLSPP